MNVQRSTYSVRQAAEYIEQSPRFISDLISNGRLAARWSPGVSYVIARDSLDANGMAEAAGQLARLGVTRA